MKIDIHSLVEETAALYPLFHYESYFRMSLARIIHKKHPEFFVNQEVPFAELSKRARVDISIEDEFEKPITLIELKYKPRTTKITHNNVDYDLRIAARDMTRFGYFADISRLEQIIFNRQNLVGYAILLSNDSEYWNFKKNNTNDDREFCIHEKRKTKRKHEWHGDKKAKGKDPFIRLKGKYEMHWEDFSIPCDKEKCKFRYLVTTIENRDQ